MVRQVKTAPAYQQPQQLPLLQTNMSILHISNYKYKTKRDIWFLPAANSKS
jgi:hypothetical protein